MSYMTTPTNEEIAQLESQTRQNLIECAKRALHVFKTDDYRVTVRGAVTFELTIKTQDVSMAPAVRPGEVLVLTQAEARRLIALTRQDCARAEFGGNGNFHDWSGLAKADDLILRVQSERKP